MKTLKFKNSQGEFEDIYNVYETSDPFNGHNYVDMGDAGYWATCNIGATRPIDKGLLFTYAELEGIPYSHNSYSKSWSDYKYCNGSQYSLTKYVTESRYGTVDNLTELEPEDDIVHVTMGGSWKMPTKEDIQKLIDLCDIECIIKNTTEPKEYYIKFTLKTDKEKQLIIPYYEDGSESDFDWGFQFRLMSSTSDNASYYYFNLFVTIADYQSGTNSKKDYTKSEHLYPEISTEDRNRYNLVRGFIPKSE